MDRSEKKSPAPGGIRTHDLSVTRCALYCCATTTAQLYKSYRSRFTLIDFGQFYWMLWTAGLQYQSSLLSGAEVHLSVILTYGDASFAQLVTETFFKMLISC